MVVTGRIELPLEVNEVPGGARYALALPVIPDEFIE